MAIRPKTLNRGADDERVAILRKARALLGRGHELCLWIEGRAARTQGRKGGIGGWVGRRVESIKNS